MNLDVQQFLLPKSGTDVSECEDAIGVNLNALRFAVADGATEAFDSQTWARRLAERWVSDEPPSLSVETFRGWVAAQGAWLQASWQGRELSWYAEEKARRGSFAAFVGLQFDSGARGAVRWRSLALGDSCLIQLRAGAILKALPLSDYQSFTATPVLVPSSALMQAALSRAIVAEGSVERGDIFLLLTDAASAWYLRLVAQGDSLRERFDFLLAAAQNEELTQLFEAERRARRMVDDDVAILRIAVA
ncbi:MAG: hypothetical protein QOF02_3384 [Blastocatellia bacterium]|jgi:hypothetical protein|nr:hypothetical protein [Blastocatellia bacterium]